MIVLHEYTTCDKISSKWRNVMKLNTVGLLVHPHREDRFEKARSTINAFQNAGMKVCVEQWVEQTLALGLPLLSDSADLMVTLGGDGTLLRAAQHAINWNIPLLGINLGNIGFLTEVEYDSLNKMIALLNDGRFNLEERMLMDVCVNDTTHYIALNDAVISRNGYSRLVTVDASASGDEIGQYRADGIIVSSPTGSTGYSLSAGGPIVNPSVQCMIMSPICAHSLQHRPVVLSADETIRLMLTYDEDRSLALVIDGHDPVMLVNQDVITIKRAEKALMLVRFGNQKFYSLVRAKLNEWTH